jgi:hypothetical protein
MRRQLPQKPNYVRALALCALPASAPAGARDEAEVRDEILDELGVQGARREPVCFPAPLDGLAAADEKAVLDEFAAADGRPAPADFPAPPGEPAAVDGQAVLGELAAQSFAEQGAPWGAPVDLPEPPAALPADSPERFRERERALPPGALPASAGKQQRRRGASQRAPDRASPEGE